MEKIVLAGGTGFIGTYLHKKFEEEGYQVLIISRDSQHISWDNNGELKKALEGAAVLVNLAGKSVDCRYTKKNKELILNSRVQTTRKLQTIVDQCTSAPKLWINACTATIYRHAEDRPMDENTGEIGAGFSVDVARAWEAAFFEKPANGTRKIALRIAITLGKDGGVMKPFVNLTKWGLGGPQGNGRQMFSWLHIEDLFRIIKFLMANQQLNGVFNCSAPNAVSNRTFMKELRHIIKPVFHLPSPRLLLEVGACLIRTETELILKSRWVTPAKLLAAGFTFKYPTIDKALQNILQKA